MMWNMTAETEEVEHKAFFRIQSPLMTERVHE